MDIKNGNVIKHDNNTDVALWVLRCVPTPTGLKVKGKWINIVNKPFVIGKTDEVLIKHSDTHRWKRYEPKV